MKILRLLVVLAAAVLLVPPGTAAAATPFTSSYTLQVSYGPSPGPGKLTVNTSGDGRASHLGRVTVTTTETLDFVAVPGAILLTGGQQVVVAANGDELHVSYSGTASAPDAAGVITVAGAYTITGGTGRFDDATGSGTFEGTVLNEVVSVSYRGTIDY